MSIVLLYKNMQPFEKDCQQLCVCHTKNEASYSYAAQNVDWKKIVGRNMRGPRLEFAAHAH